MKKKRNDEIVISCLGLSQDNVTGSCWSVSYLKDNGERGLVVLECGLSQKEQDILKAYNENKRMLENIGLDIVQNCEYVLLSHPHVDHIGNLSYFNDDNGFQGKILASHKTIEFGKELIKDSVYISNKNVEYLHSKGKKVKPLYTEPQMYQMFDHMESVEVGEKIKLNDNLTVQFHNNSHSCGSTSISLYIRKPNNTVKHILYSGDNGCKVTRELTPYLEDEQLPRKCDLFITEFTYCDKNKKITKKQAIDERKELLNKIKSALLQGKRVLIATFSYNRTQVLLDLFYEAFHDEDWFEFPVVCDGVLSNKINDKYLSNLEDEDLERFRQVMSWNKLKSNRDYKSTIATLSKPTAGIFMASSGFCCAGRIVTYLKEFLNDSNALVILSGYCGTKDSIGGQIVNPDVKKVTLDGDVILKRAEVMHLKTFSSHIQYDENIQLFSEMKTRKIIIHHSEITDEQLKEVKERLMNKGVTTPIIRTSKCCNQFVL